MINLEENSFTQVVNNIRIGNEMIELDPKGDVVTDLGGRFKYAWEVNQFGYSGTTFTAGLNFKF